MLKRFAPVALVCLLIVGCGGHSHKIQPQARAHARTVAGHACTPADYAMPCALTAPPLTLAPTTSPFASGIDFAWSCPSPAGHGFGASYLSPDGSKNWTRACVNAWHAAGAKTVAVWESSATRAQDGFAAGQADARAAAAQAAAIGEPSNRPVFFAVDFDTSGFSGPVSFPIPTVTTIYSYFRGVDSVLGVKRVGGYGGKTTTDGLFNQHLISYGWQTYAWSNGQWDPRAQLRQVLNGSAFDYDTAVAADYGQWPYTPAPVYPVCFTHRIPAKTCAVTRAKIASQQRAAASSQRAYVARGCPVLVQRIGWFSGRLKSQPHAKVAYRKAALAASRRAYQRNACGTFAQRSSYFTAAAKRLQAAN